MAELVVRLVDDGLVVWSDTVDAPTSPVMTAEAMIEYLGSLDGVSEEAAAALVRVAVQRGTSDPTVDRDELLRGNRAGPGEMTLSLADLLQQYRSQ